MTRLKLMTIASAVAAAFAVPVALAQQSATPDSSKAVQQRDATGNPSGSPTQPPRATSNDRGMNDPTMRSGSATRGDRAMGHSQYDSSTVRDVQQALQNKGFDVGPVDGVMGPRTQSALREFQQQQGLSRSGRIDQQTLSALDVHASGTGRGTMGDRSGAGTSGTSAAGGSPSAGSEADRRGTMGSGATGDRSSGSASGTTGDRSGASTSGTSAAGGSPSSTPTPPSTGSAGPGGRTGG